MAQPIVFQNKDNHNPSHMEQATNMLDGKWNDYTALQALAHAIRHGHADISNNAVVPDGVMNG